MKKIVYFVISTLFAIGVYAQEIKLQGIVTSADDGLPLPGVTVVVKGTTNGTITNIDGVYQLTVENNAILNVSFIGMKTQEVPVNGRNQIDLVLESETTDLNEVVIIGYGSQKKEDITGAVSIVGAETIDEMKPVKVEQALQGTMSGVNVTAQSGAPGAGLDIRIRGISTNGDASPVAIIDGYQGDLSLLNPSDIETITVLKDAQAAIYGTVGANGIILVTTKSGKKNTPTKVTVNTSYGIQQTSNKIDMLNATEYAVLINESYAANGQAIPYGNITALGVGTDWQDQLFEAAPIMNSDVSVSGGSDKMVYALSASSLSQEGIIGGDKTGFDRNTAKVSLGADLTDWIKFKSTIMFTDVSRQSINEFGLASVLFNALNMPSVYPVYDENSNYFLAPSNLGIEVINPIAQIANTYNEYTLSKWNGNFGLDFDITKNIKATTRIGFNSSNSKGKSFSKIVDYGGKVFDVTQSSVNQNRENHNDYTFDAFVTYDNTFNDHHFTGTLGSTVFKTWGDHLSGTGYDVPNNSWEFADISLAPGIPETKSVSAWEYEQRRLSYFARVQYDYQSKYLVSAMLRRDASTKFGPDNTVAYFPSTTLGWNISNEDFLKDSKEIDLIKLRLSYGILGSDKISDYMYISQLSGEATYVFDNALVNGTAVGASPNTAVKWEQSEQFDIGADFKLFSNRLDINTDYFIKTTNNLLIGNIPVSGILGVAAPGASGPTVNAGTVRNSGFELAITNRGNFTKDLSYEISYNITTLKNEVLEVNNGTGFIEGGSFGVGQPMPSRMEVGLPIGYFYGYKTDGIFQNMAEVEAHPSQEALGAKAAPGDLRFVDTDGDGDLDADDRTMIGSPIPAATMGLNFSLKFKGFDFIAYAYASLGNEMVRNYERVQANVNKLAYNMNRWTGEGTSTTVPRLTTAATANTIFSDFFVEDASFMRLQNMQLGYTFPKSLTEKVFINNLRLYTSVSNLFTLTKYMGYDPAASSGAPIGGGIDFGFYPAATTVTFGLNLNF